MIHSLFLNYYDLKVLSLDTFLKVYFLSTSNKGNTLNIFIPCDVRVKFLTDGTSLAVCSLYQWCLRTLLHCTITLVKSIMSKSKVAYNPSVLNKLEGKNLNGSVQTQNVRSGRVYIFGNNSTSQSCVEEDDDDETLFEMVKVRPRKGKTGASNQDKTVGTGETQKVKIIDRQVFPNDTLSKFALQYGCTVSITS